jgi:hypothetical protein
MCYILKQMATRQKRDGQTASDLLEEAYDCNTLLNAITLMLLYNTINDVQLHFATPILHKMWPDAFRHTAKLRDLILEKRWQSDLRPSMYRNRSSPSVIRS